jgi:sec-independent protein translocase protein TatC
VNAGEPAGTEQPLVAHLLELRSRLLKALGGVALVFVPLAALFAQDLYALIAAPLLQLLPAGSSMIATEVASPFLAPIKLAAVAALVIAMPWVLYQVWAFIAPGLYRSEQRLVVPLLTSSTILFYAGMAFAYFAVLPLVFRFTLAFAPAGVAVMTDITKYLDFVLALFVVFGLTFELPVALVLLVWAGFVTPAGLAAKREYVLVGVFVVAAVLTPPDVVSQILMAVPTYLLYELGIVCARWLVPGSREVEQQQREIQKLNRE